MNLAERLAVLRLRLKGDGVGATLARGAVVRSIAVSSAEEAQERFQVTILWSPDGERIYVAETGTDTIAEVDFATGKVLRRLSGGDGGDGLAILGGAR